MKTENTRAIVLSRINFGESDRIITVITPDQGKLRLMVKGARKIRSKLAGGIELFSTIEISFIRGKSDIGTLVSARLDQHFGRIINDIDRVQLVYDVLKMFNKNTEDSPDDGYYYLLEVILRLADNQKLSSAQIRFWFLAQMMRLEGHSPNLKTDEHNQPLEADKRYAFDLDKMGFVSSQHGSFSERHIKYMRLLFAGISDIKIFSLADSAKTESQLRPMLDAMFRSYLSL